MNQPANLFNDGAVYERLMGRWSRIAGQTFLDWLGLPQGLRWLDVGCGNGAFTEVLVRQQAPATTVGVDPADGQLAFARTRSGVKGVEFRVADAQALPFLDRSFDAAVMALVISFVPDPAKAVAEMKRVVRSGGTVATYMWDIPGGGLPLQPIHAAMKSLGFAASEPPGYAASSMPKLKSFWEQAGLQSIETRTIQVPTAYAGFDDFWDSNLVPVGPVGAALAKLSSTERDRLKAKLREQLPPGPDGRITYGAWANAVKGRVP